MAVQDKIKKIFKQLYPKGRAFRMPKNGVNDKFHDAVSVSVAQAYSDNLSTLDVILPDNNNFTADDATRWEERLGLIVNPSVSLAERKLAIIRKMNHPGTIPARQNWEYLQNQLQSAGFDLYVYENIFYPGPVTKNPTEILGAFTVGLWEHGIEAEMGAVEHGDFTSGSVYGDCVANYVDEDLDQWFDTGDNLRNTFFVAGPYIDDIADVDVNRKEELRQLILKIKPTQTVGFLFVNYI